MRNTLIALTSSALLGLASFAGPAIAQTSAGSTSQQAVTGAEVDESVLRRAEADYDSAKKACQSMKGAENRACMKTAKASYEKAVAAAVDPRRVAGARQADQPIPAVQVQSPAVTDTGIAPSTAGPRPAPGTPALPRK